MRAVGSCINARVGSETPKSDSTRFFNSTGELVASDVAPFTLGQSFELSARVETDRARYVPPATVIIDGRVEYAAGNSVLSDLITTLTIFDATGVELATFSSDPALLLPGASASSQAQWPSAGALAGTYRVALSATIAGVEVAHAETVSCSCST